MFKVKGLCDWTYPTLVHLTHDDDLLWGMVFEYLIIFRKYKIIEQLEGVVFELIEASASRSKAEGELVSWWDRLWWGLRGGCRWGLLAETILIDVILVDDWPISVIGVGLRMDTAKVRRLVRIKT